MAEILVYTRELKTRIGMFLERVQAGTIVIITDHGKPVGRIVPIGNSPETQMQELAQTGLLAWSGQELRPRSPVARAQSGYTVADLLIENRR
jgi:prevent-host-death family protein